MKPRLLTEETREARKEHLCIHCGEPIRPGELYVYTSQAVEGTIHDDQWHPECRAAVTHPAISEYIWDAWEPHSYKRGTLQDKWL